jgi:hypothetical protein
MRPAVHHNGIGVDHTGSSLVDNLLFGTSSKTPRAKTCPQVWYEISSDLAASFSGCNQLAANAIRFAFHDAGARVLNWSFEINY